MKSKIARQTDLDIAGSGHHGDNGCFVSLTNRWWQQRLDEVGSVWHTWHHQSALPSIALHSRLSSSCIFIFQYTWMVKNAISAIPHDRLRYSQLRNLLSSHSQIEACCLLCLVKTSFESSPILSPCLPLAVVRWCHPHTGLHQGSWNNRYHSRKLQQSNDSPWRCAKMMASSAILSKLM